MSKDIIYSDIDWNDVYMNDEVDDEDIYWFNQKNNSNSLNNLYDDSINELIQMQESEITSLENLPSFQAPKFKSPKKKNIIKYKKSPLKKTPNKKQNKIKSNQKKLSPSKSPYKSSLSSNKKNDINNKKYEKIIKNVKYLSPKKKIKKKKNMKLKSPNKIKANNNQKLKASITPIKPVNDINDDNYYEDENFDFYEYNLQNSLYNTSLYNNSKINTSTNINNDKSSIYLTKDGRIVQASRPSSINILEDQLIREQQKNHALINDFGSIHSHISKLQEQLILQENQIKEAEKGEEEAYKQISHLERRNQDLIIRINKLEKELEFERIEKMEYKESWKKAISQLKKYEKENEMNSIIIENINNNKNNSHMIDNEIEFNYHPPKKINHSYDNSNILLNNNNNNTNPNTNNDNNNNNNWFDNPDILDHYNNSQEKNSGFFKQFLLNYNKDSQNNSIDSINNNSNHSNNFDDITLRHPKIQELENKLNKLYEVTMNNESRNSFEHNNINNSNSFINESTLTDIPQPINSINLNEKMVNNNNNNIIKKKKIKKKKIKKKKMKNEKNEKNEKKEPIKIKGTKSYELRKKHIETENILRSMGDPFLRRKREINNNKKKMKKKRK